MPRQLYPVTIDRVCQLLNENFRSDSKGLSVAPSMAVYSLYQCLIEEVALFQGAQLSLEHVTDNVHLDSLGYIMVAGNDGIPSHAIVVRNQGAITSQVIKNTFRKLGNTQVRHYYFLTTSKPYVRTSEREKVESLIQRLETKHQSAVVIDGVLNAIRYYLRVLTTPTIFLQQYMDNEKLFPLSATDPGKVHLKRWFSIVGSMSPED